MNPKRRQRLLILVFIVVGVSVAVGLALFALRQNINLFYGVSEIAEGNAPIGHRIRAGGMVKDGSIQRDTDSLRVTFVLTDYQSELTVEYTGILPDLFREGQGIVALGMLQQGGLFVADEVLAKHDENYMPPEVAESLKKQHGPGAPASTTEYP